MKRMIGITLIALACALGSYADSYQYISAVFSTGSQWAVSDDLPVAGELDRVILWNTDPKGTSTVVIANYAGTAIADTIVSVTITNSLAAPVVVIPRRVGTGITGTTLTYGTSGGTGVVQQLSVPYEKFYLGGNTKVKVTEGATLTVTNYLKAQFIYKR